MNKKLTFKMLCPEWDQKFKKETLNENCVREMNSHCTCVVGEAFGIRNEETLKDAYGPIQYDGVPLRKRYYSASSVGRCRTCEDFSFQFDKLYRANEHYTMILSLLQKGRVVQANFSKKEIKELEKQLVKHFVEKHKDILNERGLPTQ